MPDTLLSRVVHLTQRRPIYRAILLEKDGTVLNACRLLAKNDEHASEVAKAMMGGHSIKLWDGSRFIKHFPHVA